MHSYRLNLSPFPLIHAIFIWAEDRVPILSMGWQLINPRTVGMALYYIIILCVDEGAIRGAPTRNRVHNFMKHAIFISHSILHNKFVLSCVMKLCTWGLQHTFFISHNILHNKFVLSCVVQLCVVYCLWSIQVNM